MHPVKWIRDTDLCVVVSWGNNFGIVDFMDNTKPPSYTTLQSGWGILMPQVWSYHKILGNPANSIFKTLLYKLVDEMTCADLCGTCDGIYRRKCTSCVPNSSPTGDSCACNPGFYVRDVSLTKKECLTCSPFCGTCSGGAATQCLTCKYLYMELKGDGSCGCPAGKYLSGTSCLDCDPSCKTCSGGSSSQCLSCDVSIGRYLSGSQCLDCDSNCKTCSGGSSTQCLSCDPTSNRYQLGASCPLCHSNCKTCSGGRSSDCITCSAIGYFPDSGSCVSCSANNSPSCPEATKLTAPTKIEELTQTITINFFSSTKYHRSIKRSTHG